MNLRLIWTTYEIFNLFQSYNISFLLCPIKSPQKVCQNQCVGVGSASIAKLMTFEHDSLILLFHYLLAGTNREVEPCGSDRDATRWRPWPRSPGPLSAQELGSQGPASPCGCTRDFLLVWGHRDGRGGHCLFPDQPPPSVHCAVLWCFKCRPLENGRSSVSGYLLPALSRKRESCFSQDLLCEAPTSFRSRV